DGHAGTPQRRVDVERVGGDAVAHPARIVVEQVGGHDLEIVVRGVGERAPAVAVAHRPNVVDVRLELIIDHDVAATIRLHAGRLESQVVGVRSSSYRHQEVTSGDEVGTGARREFKPIVVLRDSYIVSADDYVDPFDLQDLSDGG